MKRTNKNINKFILILLISSFTLISSSCNKKEKFLSDTYHFGQDYQYMYQDKDNFFQSQAKSNDGYYLLFNHFIYFIDKDTKNVTPLCNKVDCLHDQETDEDKKKECNAYFDNEDMQQIQYYNGNLYMIEPDRNELNTYYLYKISLDGSKRTKIKTWKDKIIMQWFTHRGYLYYVSNTYLDSKEGNGEIKEQYEVSRLSLTDSSTNEVIYSLDKNLTSPNINWPMAYGNHIYFLVQGYTASKDVLTDDNWFDYNYMKLIQYDIRTKKTSNIKVDDDSIVQGITFYQNKLLFHAYYPENKEKQQDNQWYLSNLDGLNMKKFYDKESSVYNYISDGKYLYKDNYWGFFYNKLTGEQQYKIYDDNHKLIDTVSMPYKGIGQMPIGDEKYIFLVFQQEDGFKISYIDKSSIGSYNGKRLNCKDCYTLKTEMPSDESDEK